MEAVLLPIVGIMIIIILCILFFSKKHIHNKETKIYSKLLILTISFLIIGLIAYIVARITANLYIVKILQKIYLCILVMLNFYSIKYCFSIFNINNERMKFLKKIFIFLTSLTILLVLFLPLNVIYYDNILDGDGWSYNVAVIYSVISFLIFIMIAGYLFYKKDRFIKISPFVVLIFLYLISFLLRSLYPELIFEGFFYAYILLIMYFTIENPDVRMIEQLNIAKDTAEKANRAKSDFLSSMSHEIRTPLNAIVGFSEDIQSYKDSLNPQVLEDANYIVEASNTLLEIVGNILDINKIESNKMEIVDVVYNPKQTIEELGKINAVRIGEKPISFNVHIAPDLPHELIGDKLHLKQILNNLLSNAFKYTNEGQVDLNVKCINNNNVCNLIISVSDTGIGIKAENINKLFSKFERLDVERNTTAEGTGLGLAITKKLVELMGGKINVQSQFGKGSIFMVTIPQKINKMTADLTQTQVIKRIELEQALRKIDYSNKKLLIVDDNKLNIKVARRALEGFNFQVIDECYNGQECLDIINSGKTYDLILMDIMMPVMSGETTIKKLKEKGDFKTPVIALTADAIAGAQEKYISLGFMTYIAKPFSRDQIKEKMDFIFKSE